MSDSRKGSPAGNEGDPATPSPASGAPKGRATPKRRVAQEAKKRPLVPSDRQAAYRASRKQRAERRARTRKGIAAGDDRYLPIRDVGPVRRFVRDYVDARWNVGEFFLPASLLVVIVVMTVNQATLAVPALLAIYALILVAVVDVVLLGRRLSRLVTEKFGEEHSRIRFYAAMRAFQIRRTRVPPPMVKRGQYPS